MFDAEPQKSTSHRVYDSEIFQPDTGFGGNGVQVESTPERNFLNFTVGTGGGCVQTGSFTPDKSMVNYPGPPSCLRRDLMPPPLNTWADPKLEKAALEAPDFVTFDRTM
jgi:tyrosinase